MKKIKLFQDDYLRQGYVARGEIKKLKESYRGVLTKNKNTRTFWNEKMVKGLSFAEQDMMTRDRIFNAVNLVGENKRIKLLDVGAGYGYFEEILNKEKNKVRMYGIDISDSAVRSLHEKFDGTFRVGVATEIPFKSNHFDVVVALEVIEHIPAEDSLKAYKEIKRVLKKGGVFICSVPVFETYTEEYNPNAHMRAYTPQLFEYELKMNGFKILEEKLFYAFKNLYSVKKFIGKIVKRWKPNVILVKAVARK